MQFAQQYFLIDRTDILKGIELKITQNVPDEYLKKEHKHSHPSWSFRIKMLSEHMVFGQDVIRCIAIEAGVDDEKYITKVIAKAKLNIITKEEKNEVCSKIYKYMSCELEEILDDNIFAFDSMESIGELYYHTIISSVENASDELLDIVIKHIYCRDEFHNKSDFYLKLCEYVGLKKLPHDVLLEVNDKYQEIFKNKYSATILKLQTEIQTLNTQSLFRILKTIS